MKDRAGKGKENVPPAMIPVGVQGLRKRERDSIDHTGVNYEEWLHP